MPEYADIYALSERRTTQAITDFLDRFLPSRVQSADEYELPQYSDSPIAVFTNASDLIHHCCENPHEVHALYWRSDATPEHAMVFFLADGGVVLGMSTPAEDSRRVDNIARTLEQFVANEDVIVAYEDTPPASSHAFRALVQRLTRKPDESARRGRVHRPMRGEPSDGAESR